MLERIFGHRAIAVASAFWTACALVTSLASPTSAAEIARVESPGAPELLSFSEAIRRALGRNPTVKIAEQEILRAEALVRQAQAAWLPTLTGNGALTRLESDRTAPSYAPSGALTTTVVDPRNQIALNLSLGVPLFAPKSWLASSRAGLAADAARLTSADVRRQIALATGHAFLAVIAARRQVEVAVRAKDTAAAHEKFSSTRLAGGLGNRLDEVRAAQDLATTVATLESELVAQARAREALGILVGTDGPVDAADDPALPAPPPIKDALEQARSRPDVLAQEKRLQVADQTVSDRWSLYAPILTAAFQPFYQNPALTTVPETGWQAQLVLTVPFYDGGLRYGQIREFKALAQEAREELDASLRQAGSDVRSAFEALQHADLALTASVEAARLAGDSLKLSTQSFEAGAITELDVLDAARRARDADSAAATAEDAARQARLDLLSAAGRFP
jgi:outer membrane protein